MDKWELIGVIGSGSCGEETASMAYEVGREIVGAGYGLICGGLGGVMEAACRGAWDAGGLTVGILPHDSPFSANPFVKVRIATGIGIARNIIIIRSASAVIAISGGPGTLSEISFCVQLGVPVVGLKSFDVFPEIIEAATPKEAVSSAVDAI